MPDEVPANSVKMCTPGCEGKDCRHGRTWQFASAVFSPAHEQGHWLCVQFFSGNDLKFWLRSPERTVLPDNRKTDMIGCSSGSASSPQLELLPTCGDGGFDF